MIGGVATRAWAAPAATSTTLAVTSAGGAVTTVDSGSVVTLTATVNSGSAAVTIGQVNFCDASATYCTDIHLLGTKQLTSTGTAVLKFIPGIGSHSFKAVFLGTTNDAASISGTAGLAVRGLYPTVTAIAKSGSAGTYTLTATVAGMGGLASPTGTVSFLDTSNGNSVLGTAELGVGTREISFLNSASPATGFNPESIAMGDFNGDGILDLAMVNSGSMTILLGNGDGTFTAKSELVITDGWFGLAVGDFNGDGIPDLAVTNYNTPTVTILLGNGDRTFTVGRQYSVAGFSSMSNIAVGDFNGDGISDLAVANSSNNTVTVLLGNGDGTFTSSPVSPRTGSRPLVIGVGDFNGDGKADLAMTNSDDTVTVLLGNGDGTFTSTSESSATGRNPNAIAVGDFNEDGRADLAITNSIDDTITILLGNGDGTFTSAASPTTGDYPFTISVGDFNGDGIPDLAVPNANSGIVTVLLGNGDGTFTPTVSPVTGDTPRYVAVGDFNGDGIPDLAVTNVYSNTVTVLLSQLSTKARAMAGGITPSGPGMHLVDASYPGDSNYSANTSGTTGLTAQLSTPTMTITPSASSITTAQALTVTVAVSGGSSKPIPTGSVTVDVIGNTSTVGTQAIPLSNGSASISIPAGLPSIGIDTVQASYSGDNNYNATTGTAPLPVTVTVAVAPGASLTGTWQITGKSTANGLTFTGTVAIQQNGNSVKGQATLSGSPCASTAVLSGSISGTTLTLQLDLSGQPVNFTGTANSALTSMSGSYTAPSGGCTNGDYGTWSATMIAVAPTPSLTVTGTAVTVFPGVTTGNTSTITMTPSGGFTGSVALTASVTASPAGAQHLPTLSFGTTSPVSITGTNAGTATLTISTTAATSATLAYPTRPGVPWYAAGGATLACILLFGIPARRRRWQTLLGMLVFLVTLTSVLSCGGGGMSSPAPTPVSKPGTTAGTYTVTVTGTSGTNTATGMVTLTVQ